MGDERVQLLAETMRLFAEAVTDYDTLVNVVARRVAEILKETCSVRLFSDDGKLLIPVAICAATPAIQERLREVGPVAVSADNPMFQRLMETPEPVILAEPQYPPEQARLRQSFGVHSTVAIGLRTRGRVIGMLSISRIDPALPPFDEHDARLAQTLADLAALAISNARLLRSLTRELGERERAEQALRKSEEQLLQAQKMDAIGQLAGGVAHDFNNLLSVIISYTSSIIEGLAPSDPLRADLGEVLRAGQRSAALTRQLLAFSRRQVLQPRVVDLNRVVAGIQSMLRRLVGEDIELAVTTPHELCVANVDPGQIEQAVVNLVVNARDAMPRGGHLTIAIENVDLDAAYAAVHPDVTPGRHAMIAVHDTGVGMDAATRGRIFEPFFTTKEPGRGTGLGLSTVFGIVKQSGGHVWVTSEPGKGTTFKLYLPSAESAGLAAPISARAPEALDGTETILVVEDETPVRTVVSAILRKRGYHVLEAQSAGDALLLCEQHGASISLLITDVVMPLMSGRQLAERVRALRPDMKVLFVSGYVTDSVIPDGVLASEVAFLDKPISPRALAAKVREVLDGPPGAASPRA